MKKLLISFILGLQILLVGVYFITPTFASESIEVRVTEKVPGAGCSGPDDKGVYTCQVGKGFGSVMAMIGRMIKYTTFIASLGAVLFIVINGILYTMSGMDSGLKDTAKKRITKTLLGLVVLLCSGLILNAIAPWVYTI